ncbi:MAG: membrane protein insertase YidC [Oscillospiraceae bacterium]
MDTITFLYSLIGTPLGYILYFIYNFICSNVGVAIILFTFIIKLAMLPLSIKQQKNSAKSAIFQPKVQEIQQKYKNNQQKQQEELAKLQQQGYKPMSGCGTMILTFLILFGVLDVVYKPMTHIVHVNSDKVSEIIEESYNVELTAVFVNEINKTDEQLAELKTEDLTKHEGIVRDAQKILDYYNENLLKDGEAAKDMSAFAKLDLDSKALVNSVIKDAIAKEYASSDGKFTMFSETDLYKLSDDEKAEMNALADDAAKADYKAAHCFSDATMSAMNTVQVHYGSYKATDAETIPFTANASLQRELYALECFGTVKNGTAYKDAYSESVIRSELREELTELYDNLNFIGIPLGQVPWDNLGFPLILVPIVSFLMALLQTFISNKMMEKTNPNAAAGMGAMKITMYIMPLFSLWLAFTIPAGAGFYWTISYVFGIIQTIVLNKLYSPEKLKAEAEAEYAERMKQVNVSATKVTDADNSTIEYNGEKLTQKEINRRKLAEARRQDALKYGEEYHDDDDND